MQLVPYLRRPHFYETDQMGVVHHSNYIRWFEEARVDLMTQVGYGYERATRAGVDIAVLGVRCEYKSMVRYGDTVRVILTLAALTPTRMTMTYRVEDAETGVLRATGESQHCGFHRERQRPVSLKKELPELYEKMEAMAVGR